MLQSLLRVDIPFCSDFRSHFFACVFFFYWRTISLCFVQTTPWLSPAVSSWENYSTRYHILKIHTKSSFLRTFLNRFLIAELGNNVLTVLLTELLGESISAFLFGFLSFFSFLLGFDELAPCCPSNSVIYPGSLPSEISKPTGALMLLCMSKSSCSAFCFGSVLFFP